MQFEPGPGEDAARPFRPMLFDRWLSELLALAGGPSGRPTLVAVDGRSGAGKTTLTRRMVEMLPRTAVVHTDDLAWNYSMFDWDQLLVDRILLPLRRGNAVEFRPPGWITHDRAGSITIPDDRSTVVVEGVGVLRDETVPLFDASVWIQSDLEESKRRGIDRDAATSVNGDRAAATTFWDEWQRAEVAFLSRQLPWSRADTIVAGTGVGRFTPDELLVARRPAAT